MWYNRIQKVGERVKRIRNIFKFLLLIVVIALGLEVMIGYQKYQEAISQKPLEQVISGLMEKPHYTAYEEIPKTYFDAVVAVEDRRFFLHHGFDPIGIARAVYVDIRDRSLREGGSTISQQLAKNLYFPQDRTPERKIAEIFLACRMEREYDKEDILEYYANVIYFGSGYYCIYDAAEGYFQKEPSGLSDAECTMLAGIPNAPSVYSPKVNPELAKARQQKVVSCMVDCGYIQKEDETNYLE